MSEPRTDTRSVNHKIAVAWDRAGSMPAKECVKVHPPDWHWMRDALVALCKERDALAAARNYALEEAAKWHDGMAMRIIQQTKMHDFDNGPAKVISREDGLIEAAHHQRSAAAIRCRKSETKP